MNGGTSARYWQGWIATWITSVARVSPRAGKLHMFLSRSWSENNQPGQPVLIIEQQSEQEEPMRLRRCLPVFACLLTLGLSRALVRGDDKPRPDNAAEK